MTHDVRTADRRTASTSLVDVIRARALERPHEPAFTFLRAEGAAATVSRGELDERARALAGRLQRAGAGGENVLLLCPPGLDYVVAFLAGLYAGARPVPAYPPRRNRSSDRLAGIVADAGARFAIGVEAALSPVGGVAGLLAAIPGLRWIAADGTGGEEDGVWSAPPAGGDDIAFLQYTSGSTAAPRGVVLTHANLLANLAHVEERCGLDHASRAVSWLPPYHDMGLIGGVLQPLYTGFPAVLMSPVAFLQSPVRWLRAISEHRATISGGPNFAYDWCVDRVGPALRGDLDLSTWRVAFNGAEPLRSATIERFAGAFAASGFDRGAIFPCYGLAEATLLVAGGRAPAGSDRVDLSRAALERSEVVQPGPGDPRSVTVVGCGPVLPANRVRIVDPASRAPLDEHAVGEIWVAGPTVARGYWNRPEETAETFGAFVAGGDGPYLRTGDLGFLRDGVLHVTGRLKDLVIIRGQNHHAEDLEDTARHSHPGLDRGLCAAFSIERDDEERLVVLHEVGRRESGAEPLVAAIRQAISEEHALRADVVALVASGTLPRTSSGKIQRHLCRQQYLAGGLTIVFESVAEPVADAGPAPSPGELVAGAPAEQRAEVLVRHLRGAAARLLRLGDPAELDPALPLSAHGLDSLMAVALQQELEVELGVRLSAVRLLEDVSLDGLAELVLREWAAARPEAAPGDREPADDGALAPAQRAMWFLQQVSPGDSAYNIATAVRVRPRLDAASLAEAVRATLARHALLRSSFPSEHGVPVRRTHVTVDGVLRVRDAGGWSDEHLRSRLGELAREPFDLASPPVIRVHLLQRQEESVLLLVVHHIAADFWSLVLLLDELTAEYGAACLGEPSGVRAPAAGYADYVRWQAGELAGDRGERLLAYWRGRLAGELPILELPSDRPRPRVPDSSGDRVVRVVPAGVADGLRGIGRAHGATLFATVLAAFQVLLHRHSGQDDVLVGVPSAARSRAGWAGVVGDFVNPVVVRSNLTGNPRFVELLRQTRDRLLEAIDHQDLPFPLLVERLQLDRDVSHSPVFQVAFDFQQPPASARDAADIALGHEDGQVVRSGLRLSPLRLPAPPAQFDLVLMMAETSGGLTASLGYRTAMFDRATAEAMVDRLLVLLGAIAAEPERRVRDLAMLTPAERRLTLVDRNATAAPTRPGTVADEFAAQAARTPDAIAVVDGGEHVTYRELSRRVAAVAARLVEPGRGDAPRVGLCAHRSACLYAAMLAILEVGGAYVPMEPDNPPERQAAIMRAAAVDVVLAEPDLAQLVPAGMAPIVALDDRLLAGDAPDRPPPRRPTPEHVAYVMSTSGSMGTPKGVMVTHANVLNFFAAVDRLVGCGEDDAVLAVIGIGFDLSVPEHLWPLCRGARVVVLSQEAITGRRPASGPALTPAASASELIERHGVTQLQCTPSTLRLLQADPAFRERLGGLRCLSLGGEPLPVDLAADLVPATPVLRNVYGPTETTIWSTSHVVTAEGGPVPIGRPIVNTQVYVVDRHLQPVPPGVPGELCIAGRGVSMGYAGQPALTAERFVPDPFGDRPGARMYRTGDLVRWRPDGVLAYIRRMDDQVKVRGHRVELGEIEQVALRHPGVGVAVVVAHTDDLGTELVAHVLPADGQPFAEADLRRHLAAALPAYMVPRTIVPVESLPLTASGKVNRRALPGPGSRRRDRDRSAVAPRTEVERTVARIWSDLLQVDGVGVDDDYFELGGHSLLATRIVARVRDELGVDLPLLEFFSAPTVAGLAAVIERGGGEEGYAFDMRVGDEVATVYLSEADMAASALPDGAFNVRRVRRGT